jgi:hypothetical protein
MLKHKIFSNNYLNHRNANLAEQSEKTAEVQGSLAVSAARKQQLPICRANERTWWEAGWKLRRK